MKKYSELKTQTPFFLKQGSKLKINYIEITIQLRNRNKTPVTHESISVTMDLKTIKENEGTSNSEYRDCKRLSKQRNSILACASMTSQIPVI